jgi:N-acetylmuramoyl-L-alanine amidase
MNILLISGHGAGDPGATSSIGGVSYREADETRRMTKALAGVMDRYCDVTVYPTDRNAYEDYKKGTLASVAQFSRYDYVLEIHFNALKAVAADGKTKGVECYVPVGAESDTTEEAICKAVASVGLTNRGVKRYNWAVISKARQSGTSAALLEVCFIDDPDDMAVYKAKFQAIVDAIASAIITAYNLKEDTMTGKEIYDTLNEYLATLPVPEWAEEELEEAKAAGITDGTNLMQMIPRYQAAIMALRASKKD